MRTLSIFLCVLLMFSCNIEQANNNDSTNKQEEQSTHVEVSTDPSETTTDEEGVKDEEKEAKVIIPSALKKYYQLELPLDIPATTSPGNKLAALGIKENQPALVATQNGDFILIKADIDESAISSVIFQLVNKNGQDVGKALELSYFGGMASAGMLMSFKNAFKVEDDKITMNAEQTEDQETSKYTAIYKISPVGFEKMKN